jgi:hypothetical protein
LSLGRSVSSSAAAAAAAAGGFGCHSNHHNVVCSSGRIGRRHDETMRYRYRNLVATVPVIYSNANAKCDQTPLHTHYHSGRRGWPRHPTHHHSACA